MYVEHNVCMSHVSWELYVYLLELVILCNQFQKKQKKMMLDFPDIKRTFMGLTSWHLCVAILQNTTD